MDRFVYLLEEAQGLDQNALGGKGFGLVEMLRAGLPVPPAFIITTDACRAYLKEGRLPEGLWEEVEAKVRALEGLVGKAFGRGAEGKPPLLVSVRSGAPVSMPGMMDTILNLGLTLEGVQVLARATGNPRFAWDTFRRLVQMYGEVVLGVEAQAFEALLEEVKARKGVLDSGLSAEELEEVAFRHLRLLEERGLAFPMDPWAQLKGAVEAVFGSWNNPRARVYRRIYGIPEDLGTAVVVQAMVFGNLGEDSGTGVGFTRNPATGEKGLYGEYLQNAQGEDVVAGIRTPEPLERLKDLAPGLYRELEATALLLERHFRDMQDFEFTVEKGKLYLLQTRSGKRTAQAAVRIAVEMAKEGLIPKEEAVLRVDPNTLPALLKPSVNPEAAPSPLLRGLPASPGAAVGRAVFSNDMAERYAAQGVPVILVRPETTPEDITGMYLSQGILTAQGGLTSHAAVVARGLGVPAVVGAEGLRVEKDRAWVGEKEIREGDLLTLDGGTGMVYLGEVPLLEGVGAGFLEELLEWGEPYRTLGVRANADTPEDAQKARAFGAEGIGLCRTEHMFFREERLPWVRKLLFGTPEEEDEALKRLFQYQREDFKGILKAMDGLPVTVRLLDAPLHEFLPPEASDAPELREVNPMLGFRGVRLLLLRPKVFQMQLRALLEAAQELKAEGFDPRPEVMLPLVSDPKEVERARDMAEALFAEYFPIPFGTMIETPRAALLAEKIAPFVDFFSFGTNDLTQMAFGLSRDDAGRFLPRYLEERILSFDPTETLDPEGVGRLLLLAAEEGRRARPGLKLGLCGEHGGEAKSIRFGAGFLDYTSASPYRVLTARLAAAQAGLQRVLTFRIKT